MTMQKIEVRNWWVNLFFMTTLAILLAWCWVGYWLVDVTGIIAPTTTKTQSFKSNPRVSLDYLLEKPGETLRFEFNGKIIPLSKAIEIISMVESSGGLYLYNPKEKAAGPIQIRPIVIKDLNQKGYEFTLQDRYDNYEPIFVSYITHYAKSRKDGVVCFEEASRIWNGGPRGPRKKSTYEYWKRIRSLT